MCVSICRAKHEDLPDILKLQYLAYQSEAAMFQNKDIPPLQQTLEELIEEYNSGVVLKLVLDDNEIIGSVRAKTEDGTTKIGKLMVHPDYRGKGYGSRLLSEIEAYFPGTRFELFTSTRSTDNIRLYQKLGYKIFDQREVSGELEFVFLEKSDG